jgi:hypothetical protein
MVRNGVLGVRQLTFALIEEIMPTMTTSTLLVW